MLLLLLEPLTSKGKKWENLELCVCVKYLFNFLGKEHILIILFQCYYIHLNYCIETKNPTKKCKLDIEYSSYFECFGADVAH